MRIFCVFIFGVLQTLSAYSQIPQITGFIRDALSGEAIQDAIVKDSASYLYTYTNHSGYYNLGLPSGRHIIEVTASGYKKITFRIDVYNSMEQDINLSLLDVLVTDTQSNVDHSINDYRSGHTAPLASQIAGMPSIMNEQDPVKFLQYLPGVSGGIEGLAGMYVRGGNADQNLMTMDGLPVFGNGHLFGFLSYFNPDIIRDVQFYRGVMPARYGGRAGSVMDVSIKEGSKDDFHGSFSSDPVALKFNINGPIDQKGKATLTLGARRSWIDLLLPKGGNNAILYSLNDYNAKLVISPNDRNHFSIWCYNGRDKFLYKYSQSGIDSLNRISSYSESRTITWQNTLAGLNFSHKFSSRHYGDFILGMSRYTYKYPIDLMASLESDSSRDEFTLNYNQNISITDFIAKANLEYTLNSSNNLRYGGEIINHSFKPSLEYVKLVSNNNVRIDSMFGKINYQQAQEASIYGEWETNLSAGLKMNMGLRIWSYSARENFFIRPEPRIMISQQLQGRKALKLGFSVANQGIHQLSSVNGNLPNDVWFPTSGNFKPQQNIQLTAGYYQPMKHGIEFSADIYYKWLYGITDLKSTDPNDLKVNYWEDMVEQGKGNAYGLELMGMKKTGKLSGLMSYTWAVSNRVMEVINFGNKFPFRWDRRHKAVIQGEYKFSKTFSISFAAVVMTGNAVSVPTGKYVTADGSFVYDYSEKNNFRMPLYKRLDFGFVKEIRPNSSDYGHQYWGITIYNLMNWKNPLFLDITRSTNSVNTAIGQSFFPFIPSIFYKWTF